MSEDEKQSSRSLSESTHHDIVLHDSVPPLDCASALALDISKNSIEIFNGKTHQVILVSEKEKLLQYRPAKVFLESTGMYHRPIVRFLQKNNVQVYEINTFKFKKFREQMSPDVKTDKQDVGAMWRFARLFQHKQLFDLNNPLEPLLRRYRLISQTVAKWKVFKESCVVNEECGNVLWIDEHVKYLNQERGKVEVELRKLVPVFLVEEFGLLLTAHLLQVEPLRFPSSRHFVSVLGLKLRTYESGSIVRRRCLSRRGNSDARRLLYLRVMNALRYGREPYCAYFHSLKGRGKVGRMAMVATMRKMARRFWAKAFGV